jgi:branched-chain amino acid transport system permease protein
VIQVQALIQITISGISLGSMYAVSAISLALVWGALGMLNMSQGALLTIGGYASFTAVTILGLPWFVGLPAAMIVAFFSGFILYFICVRWMYKAEAFDTNVIIATVGIAIIVENLIIHIYSAYPKKQPFYVDGGFSLLGVFLPYQTILIFVVSIVLMLIVWRFLEVTPMGRSIRATAQNREAAQLMGVNVGGVFAQVMCIAGLLAGVSGVMVTSIVPMSPTVGYDPMVKAFIVCAVAGLGSVPGTIFAAYTLALFEVAVQYLLGARYGFAAMLSLVIIALIWRPYGVFGRQTVKRV